jgi:hypothetical protein
METQNQTISDIGNDFLINGFATGLVPLDLLTPFNNTYFPDCNIDCDYVFPEEVINLLTPVCDWLKINYLETLFADYRVHYIGAWSGVDEGSARWHNDWIDGDPFNTNILVYLDPPLENYIAVRNILDPDSETKIYPEVGQFVWINQQKHIQHKAQHTAGPRRLLCFEFFVPNLT